MKYLLPIMLFISTLSSQALAADKLTLQRHANTFFVDQQLERYFKKSSNQTYAMTQLLRQMKLKNANCNDNTGVSPKSCIESVCAKVSKFDCDDTSEIQEIAKFCKKNIDGECIDSVCAKISKYDCDDVSEIKEVAGMCSGHYTSKCLDVACTYIDKFSCDDLSEVKDIMTGACTPDVDGDCIDAICKKMSKFNCDDVSEIKEIAKACSVK